MGAPTFSYILRLQDKHVAHVFWLRRHLLASEAAMVDPSVLVRAVWANVKRALGYHASPS